MAFRLKSRRFQSPEADPDPVDEEDQGNEKDRGEFSDSSSSEVEAEVEAMSAKGIKRLCSELLELKKAADVDFQKNVYENRSMFLGMFKEVEVVESEILELTRHVTTQKRLIRALFDNLHVDILLEDTKIGDFYERDSLALASPSAHSDYLLESLDSLLSEARLYEALNVIEMEITNLQKLQEEDGVSPQMIGYASALSDRRASLVNRFISMAGHHRISVNELHKALSGLHRLGEDDQANVLLLKFYRNRLENCMHDLKSKQIQHATCVIQLARTVFHIISLAARNFLKLFGETSSYTSELIQWAREETEALGLNFTKYIKSISETNVEFTLSVEVAKAVVYHCSFLKTQRLVLLRDLIKCIRPCMEEVLLKHVNHLKKLISISAATDVWVIGKYRISVIFGDKFFEGIAWDMEYGMLTSSGIKFITILQAFVKDASSLVDFQMEGLILHGLVELFEEYVCVIRRAIPNTISVQENESLRINAAQELRQRLALLVNSSTVLQFLQCLGPNVIKVMRASNSGLSSEHSERTILKEFDKKVVLAQKAVDKLLKSFCRQFVEEILSEKEREETEWWALYLDLLCSANSQDDYVPSFPLQAFFLRLSFLQELFKSVTVADNHTLDKLPKELMETAINWFMENPDYWENNRNCSEAQQYSPAKQFQLDLHFLMEIARIKAQFYSELKFATRGLVAQIGSKYGLNDISFSDVSQHKSESNSAKKAISRLHEYEISELLLGDPNDHEGLEISSEMESDFRSSSALVSFDVDQTPFEESHVSIQNEDGYALSYLNTNAETYDDFSEEEYRNTKKTCTFNGMEDEVFFDTHEYIGSSKNKVRTSAIHSVISKPLDIAKEEDPQLDDYLPIVESRWPKFSDKIAKGERSDEEEILQTNSNLELVVLTDPDLDELSTGASALPMFEDFRPGTEPSATASKELVLFSFSASSSPAKTDVSREIDAKSERVLSTDSGSEFIESDEPVTEQSVSENLNFESWEGRTTSSLTSGQEKVTDAWLISLEDEEDPGPMGTPPTSFLPQIIEEPDSEIEADSDFEEMPLALPAVELEVEEDLTVVEMPRTYLEDGLIGNFEYNYRTPLKVEGKTKLRTRKPRFMTEELNSEEGRRDKLPGRKPRFMQTKIREIVEEPDSEMEHLSERIPRFIQSKIQEIVGEPDSEMEQLLDRKPRFMQSKIREIVKEPDSEMELVSDAVESPPSRRVRNSGEVNPPEDMKTLEFLLNNSEGDKSESVERNVTSAWVDYSGTPASRKKLEEERPPRQRQGREVHLQASNKDRRSPKGFSSLRRTTSNAGDSTSGVGSDRFMPQSLRREQPKFLGSSSSRGSREG